MKIKRIAAVLVCLMLLAVSANAVDLYIDMVRVKTDTDPTIVEGRTLVPMRVIFEELGAQVEWDAQTRTATGTREDLSIVIQIDNKTAYVNGEPYELDVPAMIINNRTMVPARFISESLGCVVTWYDKSKTVAVADKTRDNTLYATPTGKKYHADGSCNGGTYYPTTQAEIIGRGLEPCEKCIG